MNKKRTIGIIALFVLQALLFLWWFGFISNGTPDTSLPPVVSTSTPSSSTPPSPASSIPDHLSPEEARKLNEAQVKYQSHVFDLLFLTPIVFYGKVVDTNGTPIEGATALINPTQGISGGNPDIREISDENGLFSISTHGMGLIINISKKGYYPIKESRGKFGYSSITGGDYNPHTNSKAPAIFVLRKMGETEPLIIGQRYIKIRQDGVLTDGNAVQMNLTNGHTYHEIHGDVQVESWIQDQNRIPNHSHPYDWHCKLTVLGGGLQPRMGGEFDFMAPEGGYQPSDEINMSANATPWSERSAKSYFLKLANGTYARIDFEMFAGGEHFFQITSYLNPKPGHRNLEYDPVKQISKWSQ